MIMDLHLSYSDKENKEKWFEKEWLIANGLGGYASNSILCIPTRKYHGLLVAALPNFGRTVMLNHLLESILLPDGREVHLNMEERPEKLDLSSAEYLEAFYLEQGVPVWRFNYHGIIFEKCVFLTHLQNTVYVIYRLLAGADSLQLKLYPCVHFRPTAAPISFAISDPYKLIIQNDRYEILTNDFPSLKMLIKGEKMHFILDQRDIKDVFFRTEAQQGYESVAPFWSPGFMVVTLTKNAEAAFVASTENWEEITALSPEEALDAEFKRRERLLIQASPQARTNFGESLILAADQFIIAPGSRIQDRTRAYATGDEVRTIVAGYHWFTDWGRDTMISLEGLTLCTGRYEEARWILRTFAYYVRNGLIPNMFPEGEKSGLYHTSDASLWFFHAINRYFQVTHDEETLRFIMPKLLEIYRFHINGTLFGIRADHEDGLLVQGMEGYQLTWMDAKVDGWVVTPRRGKAVEINALWYNALRLLERWLREHENPLYEEVSLHAQKVYESFNKKFFIQEKGYLYDVIEGEKGNDDALRPNQLFAISLDFPVLDKKHWESVFKKTSTHLLSPVGLRSLSPEHPDYKVIYEGNLRSRDAAYHQGTIWSWLIGPYIDTWLKLYPHDKERIREFLKDFEKHLVDAGIGYISEIFDATFPHKARGCIAQAWSIAEILRCIILTS